MKLLYKGFLIVFLFVSIKSNFLVATSYFDDVWQINESITSTNIDVLFHKILFYESYNDNPLDENLRAYMCLELIYKLHFRNQKSYEKGFFFKAFSNFCSKYENSLGKKELLYSDIIVLELMSFVFSDFSQVSKSLSKVTFAEMGAFVEQQQQLVLNAKKRLEEIETIGMDSERENFPSQESFRDFYNKSITPLFVWCFENNKQGDSLFPLLSYLEDFLKDPFKEAKFDKPTKKQRSSGPILSFLKKLVIFW